MTASSVANHKKYVDGQPNWDYNRVVVDDGLGTLGKKTEKNTNGRSNGNF